MTPACRLAAAVQMGTFGIAWQGCPAHETGGAPPISAANQDLSAEHPRDLVDLVHVHRGPPRRRAPGHRRSSIASIAEAGLPARKGPPRPAPEGATAARSSSRPARSPFTRRSVVPPGPEGPPGGRPSLPGRRRKEETLWRGAWVVQVVRPDACGVAGDARRHRRARCRLRRGHKGPAGDPIFGRCCAAAGRGHHCALGSEAGRGQPTSRR